MNLKFPFLSLLLFITISVHAFQSGFSVGQLVEITWNATKYKAKILEVGGEKYKVRFEGLSYDYDVWATADQLKAIGSTSKATARPTLTNSRWQQVSVTANGATKSNQTYIGLDLYKGNQWDLVTTISYGSGVQLLGRGSYSLVGSRLLMTHQNGQFYGDFTVSWDSQASHLILTRRNGKGVERYKYIGSL
jgi:hypothetical protein